MKISLASRICIVIFTIGVLLFPGVSFSETLLEAMQRTAAKEARDANPNLKVQLYNVKIIKVGKNQYDTQAFKIGSGFRENIPVTVVTTITAPAIVSANFKCKGKVHTIQNTITLHYDQKWGEWQKKPNDWDIWMLTQKANQICQ
jgi:hypothetical protein